MRIARFVHDSDPAYGIVAGEPGEETITVLAGDPFYQGIQQTGETHKLDDVRLVAPIIPRSKIVGVGKNYAAHAREMGGEPPVSPLLFFIPNTAVVGPGEPVTLPSFSEEISYEVELAVVIGRICKDVPVERVPEVIFGYTVGNDLTARDAQRSDNQWARAKGFDGSTPLGPWIETELDTEDLRITSRLNGKTVQDGSTSEMIFGIPELVSYISQAFTLLPGDVILTGTPAGVGLVEAGDRVEAEVEGIGTLTTIFRS
ncbi:fumarylacetoacetate hydrolase family protein [Nesterenkonia flava]|uniref:Fumarylacetoacetate hydrolase family protein n=1 Tax=Nesterenkonia flava TaxID=469799 RepID=A0ABU1FT64_9MICC|nr:fumarylacetoacetate hydrolase family protein [Nesterenkonia flava]MDR5711363.1 fumarylacetoacetate hydrolase family protein [Nesterenkonia flava]